MKFKFWSVEQKKLFNGPKNCTRDLILMHADEIKVVVG